MRIRSFTTAVAMILPLAGIAAVGPGDDCRPSGETVGEDPRESVDICTTHTYLVCPDELPQQKTQFNTVDGPVELTEDPPAASVQAGAGCGTTAEPFSSDWPTDENLVITGAYTGNLDRIEVELHILGPGTGHLGEDLAIPTVLTISDEDTETVRETVHTVSPEVSDTQLSAQLIFSFEDLGFLDEPGAGAITRTVTLEVGYPSVPDACQDDPSGSVGGCLIGGAYSYVWDTTEVPSGLIFNDTRPTPDDA